MKKFICVLFLCLLAFFSVCCKPASSDNEVDINLMVASKLEEIENIDSLEDEVVKALSVIVRTNILNSGEENSEYLSKNPHILELTKETDGEVLFDEDALADVTFSNEKNSSWTQSIKKSKILSYLSKNNISLSNISDITPIFDENNNLLKLEIGGKNISYDQLKQNFDLKSPKITSIDYNLSEIIISGEGDIKNTFNIDEAREIVNDKNNYKLLLKHFFNDFEIIII